MICFTGVKMDEIDGESSHHKLANFRVLYLVAQLVGITLIILMLSWIFIYLGGLSWSSTPGIQFNWHPLLMTIGMIYLYGNSKCHHAAQHSHKTQRKP